MENSTKISDEKLLQLCEQYGHRALLWRRKFIGLLPEVNRRRLYQKRDCQSIFEFAAKFAGLSRDQVERALQLEHRFKDKPALHALLTEGQASLSKLAKVASIATTDNEVELAQQVRLLSRKALETLARDERLTNESGSNKPLFDAKSVPGNTFELSPEVLEELNELQAKGQDVNKILLELLKERKRKIEEQKEVLSQEAKCTTSRYIPKKVRTLLQAEHGEKCSIKTCNRSAEEVHHTQRFSLTHTHDPRYLAPLCKEHHQIAHSIDQKVTTHRQVLRS